VDRTRPLLKRVGGTEKRVLVLERLNVRAARTGS
jgi:hypothetical protein